MARLTSLSGSTSHTPYAQAKMPESDCLKSVKRQRASEEQSEILFPPLTNSRDSIRVLQVLPVLDPNGLIQCVTTQSTVRSQYLPISYEWGTAPGRDIKLNGSTHGIGENLHRLLKYARTTRAGTWLWIDAVQSFSAVVRQLMSTETRYNEKDQV